MSGAVGRGHGDAEHGRAQMWLWPVVGGAVALVVAVLLTELRPLTGTPAAEVLWPGDVDAARALLQTVATAAVTILTFSFSVTVVALQLASQQFSPRLLRDFARDPVIKATLVVLVVTAVHALTTLRRLDAADDVPSVAVVLSALLGLASLVAVVLYISHVMRRLRVESMMVALHADAVDAVRRFYPDRDDDAPVAPDEAALPLDAATCVVAARSGFVRRVDVPALVRAAREHDVLVRLEVRPGDHVTQAAPLAAVWSPADRARPQPAVAPTPPTVPASLASALRDAVELGYERTVEQDASFGFRQLEDIAVKAVSPAINDPATAAHAVGYMGDLVVELSRRRLGPTLHLDDQGVGRAVVQDRDLRYYLDLACGQLRRYGASEPTVLVALLRLLRDAASCVNDDVEREEVRRQVGLVVGELSPDRAEADQASVLEMARRVEEALGGRVLRAYRDRSGETRSM